MRLLKASEANSIAKENNGDNIMEKITSDIIKKAENGEFELKVREFGFGDSALYTGDMTPLQKSVVDKLIELGYKAKVKTEEKQFVDIYLHIEW